MGELAKETEMQPKEQAVNQKEYRNQKNVFQGGAAVAWTKSCYQVSGTEIKDHHLPAWSSLVILLRTVREQDKAESE